MELNTFAIRLLLAEKQMSQTDLAKVSGIARQNISVILAKGRCSPTTAWKISSGLGVHVFKIVKEAV